MYFEYYIKDYVAIFHPHSPFSPQKSHINAHFRSIKLFTYVVLLY
nr:MAG TPA: hypothetical protein [Caudoviricetes sp.]